MFFVMAEIIRTADYKRFQILEVDLSIFKFFFNTLLGVFINPGDLNLPDREITPSSDWNNTLSVFFNLIFLFFLLLKNKDNFWIFLSKNLIIFYLIHIFLSQISPFYYSLNLFFLDTMTWSKVNIEIYIFQLVLLSFFISGNYDLSKKKSLKIYYIILFVYLTIITLFSIDVMSEFYLSKYFFKKLIIFLNIFQIYTFEDADSLNLFANDVFDRFNYIIDFKFILIQISSIILIFITFSFKKLKKIKNIKLIFLLTILFNNYLITEHFTPIEKKNYNLWENALNENVIKEHERIISLSQNYLFNIKNENINIKQLNVKNIKDWIARNPIKEKDKYYGIMSPPYLSFSSNASFINKDFFEDSYPLFKSVPEKIKSGFTAKNSFEILQEGIYNMNYINNLSIKYAYSVFDLEKLGLLNKNLILHWNDDNLYIYKILGSNDYSYVAEFIKPKEKKIYEYKIKNKEVYLSKEDYQIYKNLKTGPSEFKLDILNNSYFKIYYKSNYENIIVISNSFHKNWKHNSETKIDIIKINDYFTGLVIEPGEYNFELYFDNSKYLPGVYFSLIMALLILIFYIKNLFNLRK